MSRSSETPEPTELKTVTGRVSNPSEADAVARIARESIQMMPMDLTVPQYALAPEGTTEIMIDPTIYLPDFTESPRRATGTYEPATVAAFIDFVKTHADPAATTIWVPVTRGPIIAVLNDHASDETSPVTVPGWGDHRAFLQLTTTPEWEHWLKLHGQMVEQEEFAEHIEEGLEEVVLPDGADLLEVAQSIQASFGGRFKKSHRLQDGRVQMEYTEEVDASAGETGHLTIPREILLAIAPFAGEDAYRIPARFRYRINGGKLALGYKLDRPELVLRDAFQGIAERLKEQFPRVYVGEPASSRGN